MMVFSTKITKAKLLAFALVCSCVALILIVSIPGKNSNEANAKNTYIAATNEDRVMFLQNFGWEIEDDPVEVSNVVIPTTFDSTYETYNNLQKTQGLDLNDFKGMQATRYTYSVKNYQTNQGVAEDVQANILVVDDKIVAGDVTSVSLGGFMQGLARSASSQVVSSNGDSTGAESTGVGETVKDSYSAYLK